MLEAVERTPKGDAKLRLLFSDALRKEIGEGDMYPLLRLVLPQLDRERTYSLKEKKIARVFVEVLGMASASSDAQKLERFNDPTVVQSKSVGDFAAVLYEVLQYRSLAGNAKFQHTLGVVNELLDALVCAETHAARKKVFMRLATEFPALEQKWIVRIMLKDLKIGLRHERVLNFLHPDAPEMYNHTNDLHKVCTELRNSSVRYVPKIEPFQVFSPMLAKRVDFGECTSAINADAFVMEPKLDGERVTCHVQGKAVQLISRNGTNYTDLYGPAIAPYILSQLTADVDCILDGEMMVWDNLEYRMREFGLLKGVANAMKAGEETHRWLCYIVWDVVYLGGTSGAVDRLIRDVYSGPGEVSTVMGLPLHVRRELLVRLVKPLDHRIVVIEQTLVNAKSAKERHDIVMAEVDRQVSSGGEGVILKDVNSHYMCGESSRKTKKWIKLKPDYAGMTTNLDVIILGGFYGTGRRRSGDVSVFMLGVVSRSIDEKSAEEAMKPGAPCPVFYTFAKVGTGYNLDELEQMRRELEPHWQVWDSDNIPPHLNGWKPLRNDVKPDVWIDPRHSKILEVYGFELTFTNLYQTGLTIRFPRCKAIRADKEWYQCMTVQELNATRGSMFNKRAAEVAIGQKKAAKRPTKKQHTLIRAPGGVLADYSQPCLDSIQPRQDVFHALEFCVLPGKYETRIPESVMALLTKEGIISSQDSEPVAMPKQAVEKMLHAYGATIVQNAMAGTTNYVLAASDAGLKVGNLKKQGMFDIVCLSWVVRCISSSQVEPAQARDFVFTTETTRAKLAKEYDQFGDHFTQHVRPEELRALLNDTVAKIGKSSTHWQDAVRTLPDEEAEAMDTKWTFLSHCVLHFDPGSDHSSARSTSNSERVKLLKQRVRLYGGVVAPAIDASVTHIVVVSRDAARELGPAIRLLRRTQQREPPVVTSEWVDACINDQAQVPVSDFFVPV
jgi:DNA ligase-4